MPDLSFNVAVNVKGAEQLKKLKTGVSGTGSGARGKGGKTQERIKEEERGKGEDHSRKMVRKRVDADEMDKKRTDAKQKQETAHRSRISGQISKLNDEDAKSQLSRQKDEVIGRKKIEAQKVKEGKSLQAQLVRAEKTQLATQNKVRAAIKLTTNQRRVDQVKLERDQVASIKKNAKLQSSLARRSQAQTARRRQQFATGVGAGVFAGSAISPFGIAAGAGALSAGGATAAGAAIAIPATIGITTTIAVVRELGQQISKGISLNSEYERSWISLAGVVAQFNDIPLEDSISLSKDLADALNILGPAFALTREEAKLTILAMSTMGATIEDAVANFGQLGAVIKTLTAGQPFERQIFSEIRALFGLGSVQGALLLKIARGAASKQAGREIENKEFFQRNTRLLEEGRFSEILGGIEALTEASKELLGTYDAQTNILKTQVELFQRKATFPFFQSLEAIVIRVNTVLLENQDIIDDLSRTAGDALNASIAGALNFLKGQVLGAATPFVDFDFNDLFKPLTEEGKDALLGRQSAAIQKDIADLTAKIAAGAGEKGDAGKLTKLRIELIDKEIGQLRESLELRAGVVKLIRTELSLEQERDKNSTASAGKFIEIQGEAAKRVKGLEKLLALQEDVVALQFETEQGVTLKISQDILATQDLILISRLKELQVEGELEKMLQRVFDLRAAPEKALAPVRAARRAAAFRAATPAQRVGLIGGDISRLEGELEGLQGEDDLGERVKRRVAIINLESQATEILKGLALQTKATTMAIDEYNLSLLKTPERLKILIQQQQEAVNVFGQFGGTIGPEGQIIGGADAPPEAVDRLLESIQRVKDESRDAFAPLQQELTNITQTLIQAGIAGENFGDTMRRALAGLAARGIGFGVEGIFKSLFSAIGAGLSVGAVGGGGGGGQTFALNTPLAAHGATPRANQPFIVGEEGPELFIPSTAGRIVPNDTVFGGGPIIQGGNPMLGMNSVQAEFQAKIQQALIQDGGFQAGFAPSTPASPAQEATNRNLSAKDQSVGGWQTSYIKGVTMPPDSL